MLHDIYLNSIHVINHKAITNSENKVHHFKMPSRLLHVACALYCDQDKARYYKIWIICLANKKALGKEVNYLVDHVYFLSIFLRKY